MAGSASGSHGIEHRGELVLQGTIERLGVLELLARDALGQAVDDLGGGLDAHVGHQQLCLEILDQLVVDLLLAQEQPGDALGEVGAGLAQAGTNAREPALLLGHRLLLQRRAHGLRFGLRLRFRLRPSCRLRCRLGLGLRFGFGFGSQRLSAQHLVLLFPVELVERLGALVRLVRRGAGHGTLLDARGIDHVRLGGRRLADRLVSRGVCWRFLGGLSLARFLFFGLRRSPILLLFLLLFLLLLALEKTEHGEFSLTGE